MTVSDFAGRGSLRAQLVRIGAFFYFAYAYLVILFGIAYNPMFLVYAALLSASTAGLVLSLVAVDVDRLSSQFRLGFARRTIAWAVIAVSVTFALLWLSRIVPGILAGKAAPGLESYTTLSVQGADLSLVIPISTLTGIGLLRRRPIGYLLIAPVLIFMATMGLGLVGVVVAMALMGTSVGIAGVAPAAVTGAHRR